MKFSSHRSAPVSQEELDVPPIFLASEAPSLQCSACLGREFTLAIVQTDSEGRTGVVRCEKCRKTYPVRIVKETYGR
jgi:DNA-directed RNA polymerase subunit M/transcription elongation factor TFIIS